MRALYLNLCLLSIHIRESNSGAQHEQKRSFAVARKTYFMEGCYDSTLDGSGGHDMVGDFSVLQKHECLVHTRNETIQ